MDCVDCGGSVSSPVCKGGQWVCTGGTCGTGGSGGASKGGAAGATSGGAGGEGGCDDLGAGGADCIDSCTGEYTPPVCTDGKHWTCENKPVPPGQVPTADGCLTCGETRQRVGQKIEGARAANDSCAVAEDCVMTSANTHCAGACEVAVSKTGEAAFKKGLSVIDGQYCFDYTPECGFLKPKCALPKLLCTNGSCEAKYN